MIKTRLKTADDIAEHGLSDDREALTRVAQHYAIGITPQVLSTITSTNDAIARQYVPSEKELITTKEELLDPIGDHEHEAVKGLIHRYPDRVLLKIAEVCAVYCRYCFRREMVGPGHEKLSTDEISAAMDYIRVHRDIHEVILTGGDPLVLSARHLQPVFDDLAQMDHIGSMRIHTRIPIADPGRIGNDLIALFKSFPKPIHIAVHVNHPAEIDNRAKKTLARLHGAGVHLLSQSVLLNKVNDCPDVLDKLYRALIANHVQPYYLHHPDLAKGTSHFRLSIERGQEIYKELLGKLSGIARPHYMLDIPGGYGKVPVSRDYIEPVGDGIYKITDYRGQKHFYPPQESL